MSLAPCTHPPLLMLDFHYYQNTNHSTLGKAIDNFFSFLFRISFLVSNLLYQIHIQLENHYRTQSSLFRLISHDIIIDTSPFLIGYLNAFTSNLSWIASEQLSHLQRAIPSLRVQIHRMHDISDFLVISQCGFFFFPGLTMLPS